MRCTFFILIAVGALGLTLSSCKKGCTNTHALNYTSSAKEDDGSCLFCDSVAVSEVSGTNDIRDYNTGPHTSEYVLRTVPIGNVYKYEGNHCAALGFTDSGCAGSTFPAPFFVHADFRLENLTSDTLVIVHGDFNIRSSGTSSVNLYRVVNNVVIPPNGSILYPEHFYFNCFESSFVTIFMDDNNNVQFIYK